MMYQARIVLLLKIWLTMRGLSYNSAGLPEDISKNIYLFDIYRTYIKSIYREVVLSESKQNARI